MTTLAVELGPKRLELLHELVPAATTVALLVNPTNPTLAKTLSRDVQAAARNFRLTLHILQASTERDFDGAFARLARLQADGLVIGTDAYFTQSTTRSASGRLARRRIVVDGPLHALRAAMNALPSSAGEQIVVEKERPSPIFRSGPSRHHGAFSSGGRARHLATRLQLQANSWDAPTVPCKHERLLDRRN